MTSGYARIVPLRTPHQHPNTQTCKKVIRTGEMLELALGVREVLRRLAVRHDRRFDEHQWNRHSNK